MLNKKYSFQCQFLLLLFTLLTVVTHQITYQPHTEHRHQDRHKQKVPLLIFHFNDAYDLQPLQSQPKAGAAHFKTLLTRHRNQYLQNAPYISPSQYSLTLFSGDVYAPSVLSREYHGQNMIKPLNQIGTDAATFGNHQFDYPLKRIIQLTKNNTFPWINSNMIDKRTQERLANGTQYQTFIRNGLKTCFFSLIQQQILNLLIPQYFDITQILPFIQFAKVMVKKMQQLQCDLIIALTHMTLVNDRKLAREVDGIDIILGGHDHLIAHQRINNTVIIKSGADFKHFSKLKLFMKKQFSDHNLIKDHVHDHRFQTQKFIVFTTLLQVNHQKHNLTADPSIHQYVTSLYQKMRINQQRTALITLQPINLNFLHIRTQYSPYLTFISQLYKHAAKADCAIINSGAFRASATYEAGQISKAIFMNFIKDQITVKVLTGEQIYKALDNSVSMYPSQAGRYSQVAGIQFTWDRAKAPNQRVLKQSIKINGHPLEPQQKYRVAFRDYISKGADGFLFLKNISYAQHNYPIPMLTIMSQYIELDHTNLLRGFPYQHVTQVKMFNQVPIAVLDLSQFERPRIVMIDSSVPVVPEINLESQAKKNQEL